MSGNRIRALDGVRACAVILVVLNHAKLTFGAAPLGAFLYAGNGELGVGIFFALSGFLITTLLLREKDRGLGIDLGAFYQRRARRILPAFYAWLAVIALLAAAHRLPVSAGDLISTAFFVRNWTPGVHTWWTANAWTLCIEEWFYLGFPALLLLLRKDKPVFFALLAVVAVEPIFRVVQLIGWLSADTVEYQIHTRLDTIAWGCLLAFSLRDPHVVRWFRTRNAQYITLGAAAAIFLIIPTLDARLPHHMLLKFMVGMTLEGVGVAVLLGFIVTRPDNPVARFLAIRPLVWIGSISYSLYLWQELFLTTLSPVRWPLNFVAALVCACVSYYGIERPILQARARRASAGAYGAVMISGSQPSS